MSSEHAEVVIIGAGFAGLSAARALERRRRVIVLEADDRVGGRAWTTRRADGVAFDHGAQYIGRDHQRVMALIDEFGMRGQLLDYVPGFGADPVAVSDLHARRMVTRRSESYFQIQGLDATAPVGERLRLLAALGVMEGLCRLIDAEQPASTPLGRYFDTISFADYVAAFGLLPWFSELLLSGVRGVWSQDPERMSALYVLWYIKTNGGFAAVFNDQDGGPQQYGLACGLGGLAERLAASLDELPRLECPVRRVELLAGDRLRVTADRCVIDCDEVVVATTPRAVRNIEFEPALSPARRLLARQPGGYAIKALVVYERPWWRERAGPEDHVFAWLDGRRNSGIDWILDASPPDRPCYMLVCFVAPTLIDALPDDDPHTREAALADALVELTRDPAAREFTACEVVDWRAQPWHGGGPNTNFEPGVLTRVAADWRRPEHGRIHFAAAEYASSYTGYVEGAIASGRAVAARILGQPCEQPRPRWPRRLAPWLGRIS